MKNQVSTLEESGVYIRRRDSVISVCLRHNNLDALRCLVLHVSDSRWKLLFCPGNGTPQIVFRSLSLNKVVYQKYIGQIVFRNRIIRKFTLSPGKLKRCCWFQFLVKLLKCFEQLSVGTKETILSDTWKLNQLAPPEGPCLLPLSFRSTKGYTSNPPHRISVM